jgi:metal-responsive CopG/Arc/MetJ family transcriptional regulator
MVPSKLEEGSETVRVQIVTSENWLERIDEWRRKQPRIPNRSEAIRVLVDWALERDAGS